MNSDKQLVRITVFVLIIGIVLVYAVFFNIQGETLASGAAQTVKERVNGVEELEEDNEKDVAEVTGDPESTTGDNTWSVENTGTTMVFSGLDALFGDDRDYLEGDMRMLTGTSIFQGNIDVLNTLGINYEYVLKDNSRNIFYVYIGRDKVYNFREIAAEFGWKTVEIISQKDIINNLYFGDRVTFIELPQYTDVKVNVFIQMGNDLWMIQDDASQYRAHKKYIRQLFTGK